MHRELFHNKRLLRDRRKNLRTNGTREEAVLWRELKQSKLGYKFKRQSSIGPYIADFYCPTLKLVIELDGSQHEENKGYDERRTEFLVQNGCQVLRFLNGEVHRNLSGVLLQIMNTISKPPRPSGHPS